MCLVSSYPLLFKLIPYNFGLSAFSFYPFSRHPRERGEPSYSECCSWVFPLHCQCCCLVVLCCCLLRRVRVQMRHPECVDEWIPVCTGMTIGGVAAVSEFSSLQLIFVRLFLSVFYLVILADAGIHRTASVVARYYHLVTGIVVGLFYVVGCGKCVSKRDIRRVWINRFPCARE